MKDFENLPLDRSELFGGGLSKLLMIIAHPLGWQVCFCTLHMQSELTAALFSGWLTAKCCIQLPDSHMVGLKQSQCFSPVAYPLTRLL
jgi:hypothetical protein